MAYLAGLSSPNIYRSVEISRLGIDLAAGIDAGDFGPDCHMAGAGVLGVLRPGGPSGQDGRSVTGGALILAVATKEGRQVLTLTPFPGRSCVLDLAGLATWRGSF